MSARQVTYTLSLKDHFSSKIKDATLHVITLNKELRKTKRLLNVLGTFSSGAKSPMSKMAKSTAVATTQNNRFNSSLARTERGLIRINGLIRSASSSSRARMIGGTSFSGSARRSGAGMGYGSFEDAMYANSSVGRYRGSSINRAGGGGGGGGGGGVPPFNPYAFAGWGGSGNKNTNSGSKGRRRGSLSSINTGGSTGMGGVYTMLASGFLVKGIVDATARMQALENQFKFSAGGVRQGADELAFISQQSEYLGLNFEATARSYAKLAAATKDTKIESQTRDIFKGIATSASVMHLTADETNRAMFAMQQMVSKGKVSSEELNRQFGEIVPGANKRASEAMRLTTQALAKQMQRGELFSEDFLPAFAARLYEFFVVGVEDSRVSLQSNLSRMENAWFKFKAVFGTSMMSTITGGIKILTHFMHLLGKLPAFYKRNAKAIDFFAKVAGRLLAIFITWKLVLKVLAIRQWALNAALAFGKIMNMGWAGVALVAAAGVAVWGVKTLLASEAQKALNDETERGASLAKKGRSWKDPFGLLSKKHRGVPSLGFPFKHSDDTYADPTGAAGSSTTSVEARQPQIFNIDIEKFGEMTINTKNISESASNVKEQLTQALVEAVNNFQIIAAK